MRRLAAVLTLGVALGISTDVLPDARPLDADLWRYGDDGLPRPAEPAFAQDVVDPLFALLAGVVDGELFGVMSGAYLDSLLASHGGSKMPIEPLVSVERKPCEDGCAKGVRSHIRLEFQGDIRIDFPYKVLTYKPGAMVATRSVELDHWDLGDSTFRVPGRNTAMTMGVRGLHVFWIRQGEIRADVDAFLDRLMGARLDDIDISGFATFLYRKNRHGLAFGYNPQGRGRTGGFDFTRDTFHLPTPRLFLVMGRTLRTDLEDSYQKAEEPR